jgi:hypothetical protein
MTSEKVADSLIVAASIGSLSGSLQHWQPDGAQDVSEIQEEKNK